MTHRPDSAPLTWEIDVPLVGNPDMLVALLKVFVGSGVGVGLLIGLVLALQGDGALAARMLGVFVGLGLALFALSLPIMLLGFGNRLHTSYFVDEHGVNCELHDRRARGSARAALWLGLLAGRPTVAGAGWLALAGQRQSLRWAGGFDARAHPARRTITLHNRWRRLMTVYCSADNYAAVKDRIESQMAAHGTDRRALRAAPLGPCLRRSAALVVAAVPLFVLTDVFAIESFIPLLLLCLALAMVWLASPLAWAVLAAAIAMTLAITAGLLEWRSSIFAADSGHWRYQSLSGDNVAWCVLAALGLAYLAWLAVQTLRGRFQSMLESDLQDATGP